MPADPTTPAAGAGPTPGELARIARECGESTISAAADYLRKWNSLSTNLLAIAAALERLAQLETPRPWREAPEGEVVLWHRAETDPFVGHRSGNRVHIEGHGWTPPHDFAGWTPLPVPPAPLPKEATQP